MLVLSLRQWQALLSPLFESEYVCSPGLGHAVASMVVVAGWKFNEEARKRLFHGSVWHVLPAAEGTGSSTALAIGGLSTSLP